VTPWFRVCSPRIKPAWLCSVALFLNACCPPFPAAFCPSQGPTLLPNYLNFQVGPWSRQYPDHNRAFASVTVCVPGTPSCQTIDHIILDSASVGLRIYKQALTIQLPPEQDHGQPLADCAQFASGYTWGSVNMANVVLAAEPAALTPVQVIDFSFETASPPCDPTWGVLTQDTLHANGIMGIDQIQSDLAVGGFAEYFLCQGGTCSSDGAVTTAMSVQNSIFLLPQDNNGIFILVKQIPCIGSSEIGGSLILGIGTEPVNGGAADNDPNVVSEGSPYTKFDDPIYSFTTIYKGSRFDHASNLDTGTPWLNVPNLPPLLRYCGDQFCPNPSPVNLSAVLQGHYQVNQTLLFQIANDTDNGNTALNNFASQISVGVVWGFPFFYGKSVMIMYNQPWGNGSTQWGYAILPPGQVPQCPSPSPSP
jgi:hypothetical protein